MTKTLIPALFLSAFIAFFSPAQAQTNSTPSSPWYVDHVVIVVNDLSDAVKDFTKLGFTVISGGRAGGGFDHNALIPFSDGSYIELYAPINPHMMGELQALKNQHKLKDFTKDLNAMDIRFVNHVANGEGLADFAIAEPDLDLNDEIIDLHDQALSFVGPIPMNRMMPNGRKITWEVALPETDSLPFLITDVTPRYLRVGTKKPALQKNWVTGLASITVAVDDLEKASQAYQTLLGMKPVDKSSYTPPDNVKIVIFRIGRVDIILAQPTDTDSPLYHYLTTHGNGLYHMALYTTSKAYAGKLNTALTHKTNIKLIYK